jgi:hypothetical protein
VARINENLLAKQIASVEGLKEQVTIAQIKEVQAILLDELADEWATGNEVGVIELIKKHG